MKLARVLTLCTVVAAVACHRESETPQPVVVKPHVPTTAAVKKGPTPEQLTAGMVEAASQGKSQLAVKLKFDLPQKPTLGQALDIDLAVMPQIDANGADLQVTGGDGLTVAPAAAQIALAGLEAGQVYRQSVKVTPTVDGVLVLGLIISLKHDEITESRAFSIPLIVER
jgi:hypothetical protein